jgi:hypothetical protein
MESALGAFRRPRTHDDRLPAIAATEVRGLGPESVRPPATIKAQATDGVQLFLTPAAESVCVSLIGEAGATVNCLPREMIEQGSGEPSPSMVLTGCTFPAKDPSLPACKRAILYGVVPDGVEQVTLDARDAASKPTVNVVRNSYVMDVPIGQETLSIKYN